MLFVGTWSGGALTDFKVFYVLNDPCDRKPGYID